MNQCHVIIVKTHTNRVGGRRMSNIEGGCLCGSVRYTSDAEPAAVINCYCAACRKNSGSTNSFNLAMPEGTVKVTGDTVATYVDHSGSSGKPFERHFCSKYRSFESTL